MLGSVLCGVYVCVCLEFLEVVTFIFESTDPYPRGRQMGKVGSRDKKNHAIVSLHQICWEKIWV